ncbi:hypothetical protein ACFL2B_00660 [Patescibacteria group bacterium]
MKEEVKNIIDRLSDDEQDLIKVLSQVVSIAGEIYVKQGNPGYPGGNLYPHDMTREEFDQAAIRDSELKRFDTVVERVSSGGYRAVPYNEKYSSYYARMIELLEKARSLSPDPNFRVYIRALIACLEEGTQEAYRHMTKAWVETKDYYINFVFTYDELYADRLLGLKGSFNAILFLEDPEMTPRIMQPVRLKEKFLESLSIPGEPIIYPGISPAVYYTVVQDGLARNFEARAWNCPDDPVSREQSGTRQMIVREVMLNLLSEQLRPIIREIFCCNEDISDNQFRDGFFWTITLHEICHNVGNYRCYKNLEKYSSVFEELKNYIIPIYWMFFCQQEKVCLEKEVKASVFSYLAYSLANAVLGEKVKERESYLWATLILWNYLVEKKILIVADNKVEINFNDLPDAFLEIFNEVIGIMEKCSYDQAKEYVEKYSDKSKFTEVFKVARKLAKIDD